MTTRLLTADDAPRLAALLRENREFLAPWEPVRDEAYFTDDGQRAVITDALAEHAAGRCVPHAIVADGAVVGRITLNGVVRGPFLSCAVGYWVAEPHTGQGLATSALRAITGHAFGDLGLHRVQAETLLHNAASQRVLERVGFEQIGLAPSYLRIAGAWQDMRMFQLLADGS